MSEEQADFVDGEVYGPRTVTKVYQVSIPVALLQAAGMGSGSRVSYGLLKGQPGAICIFDAGRVVVDGKR